MYLLNIFASVRTLARGVSVGFHTMYKKPQILNCNTTLNIQRRSKFSFSMKKPNAENFKKQDKVPEQYNLIYRNSMDKYLVVGQICSAVGLFTVALAVLKSDYNNPMDFSVKDDAKHVQDEQLVYLTAFVGFAVLLQSMIYKLPLRIYNFPQKDKYIFMFYRSIPFQTRSVVCQVKDISKTDNPNILPWGDSQYEIDKKQKVILVENFFRRPADLSIMLGHQKNDEVL